MQSSDGNIYDRVIVKEGYNIIYRSNPRTRRPNQVLVCTMDRCGREFSKLCNVRDHLNTHRNVKDFKCNRCGRAFAQKGNRDRHQRSGIKCQLKTNRQDLHMDEAQKNQ